MLLEVICIVSSVAFGVIVQQLSYQLNYWSILIGIIGYLTFNATLQFISKWYGSPFKSGSNPKHLIIVTKGYLGHYLRTKGIQDSFKHYIKNKLNRSNDINEKDEDVMVYLAKDFSNGFFFYTLYNDNDGIDNGGQRLYQEIKGIIKKNKSIDKISFFGCSLGGLYNRYCLKSFEIKNNKNLCIDDRIIKPMNFISLASPHIGVEDLTKKKPFCCSKSVSVYDAAKFMKRYHLISKTVQQLLLLDKENLIIQMATDNEYLAPLQLFENRICFGNVKYDRLVSCSSALMLYQPKQSKFNEEFWDKMVSENNKFMIQQLERDKSSVNNEDIDNNNQDYWFDKLGNSIKWKKIMVGFNQNHLTRRSSHFLLAAPSFWYSGCQPIFQTIHQNFIY